MSGYEKCSRESCRAKASHSIIWDLAPPTRVCRKHARGRRRWEAQEAAWLRFKHALPQLPKVTGPPVPDPSAPGPMSGDPGAANDEQEQEKKSAGVSEVRHGEA